MNYFAEEQAKFISAEIFDYEAHRIKQEILLDEKLLNEQRKNCDYQELKDDENIVPEPKQQSPQKEIDVNTRDNSSSTKDNEHQLTIVNGKSEQEYDLKQPKEAKQLQQHPAKPHQEPFSAALGQKRTFKLKESERDVIKPRQWEFERYRNTDSNKNKTVTTKKDKNYKYRKQFQTRIYGPSGKPSYGSVKLTDGPGKPSDDSCRPSEASYKPSDGSCNPSDGSGKPSDGKPSDGSGKSRKFDETSGNERAMATNVPQIQRLSFENENGKFLPIRHSSPAENDNIQEVIVCVKLKPDIESGYFEQEAEVVPCEKSSHEQQHSKSKVNDELFDLSHKFSQDLFSENSLYCSQEFPQECSSEITQQKRSEVKNYRSNLSGNFNNQNLPSRHESLHEYLQKNYGPEALKWYKKLAKTSKKLARLKNVFNFFVDCRRYQLTPKCIKIRIANDFPMGREIIQNAEKELLTVKIRHLFQLREKHRREQSMCYEQCQQMLSSYDFGRVYWSIWTMRERIYLYAKRKQKQNIQAMLAHKV